MLGLGSKRVPRSFVQIEVSDIKCDACILLVLHCSLVTEFTPLFFTQRWASTYQINYLALLFSGLPHETEMIFSEYPWIRSFFRASKCPFNKLNIFEVFYHLRKENILNRDSFILRIFLSKGHLSHEK